MNVIQNLIQTGLSEKEAKIYTTCLELGESTILEISKKSTIKRTTVYETIETLKEQGLVKEKKGKKKLYSAVDPIFIQKLLEDEMESFSKVLPLLHTLAQVSNKKPSVRVYQGTEEVKQIYRTALQTNPKEMCIFALSQEAHEELVSYVKETHTGERVKRGIPIRIIWNKQRTNLPKMGYIEGELKRMKYIDSSILTVGAEVFVFGNRVAIISSKSYEPFGMIIISEAIALFVQNLFEYVWDRN